jgi:vanillate O-demethylase ferredoxin subunit
MSSAAFTQVVVAEIANETADIVTVRLRRSGGHHMPPFAPGSHIELVIPNGARRYYSICSDPEDLSQYEIAVLREAKSRGGSDYIHDSLDVGDVMLMSAPRSAFSIANDAQHHVLIAGGIGITPFMPMIHSFVQTGVSYELHYLARAAEHAAFLDRLTAVCELRFSTYFTEAGKRLAVADLLGRLDRDNAQIYCCGPKRLMDEVLSVAAAKPGRTPRFEAFSGVTFEPMRTGESFEVEIASSGKLILVRADETLLQALRRAGCDAASSCEHGICGTCVVGFSAGEPIHRDGVLNNELRRDHIAPCVSRAKGRITLNL